MSVMRLPVTALRLVFATGYVLLCAFGAGLLMYPAQRSEADRYVSLFFGVLLALIGVAGLVLVLFIPVFDRCRPGPVPATAPSDNLAMFFRRGPFMVVTSVVFCLAFAVWAGTLAVVLHRHGYVVWASMLAVLALVLLWPVAAVQTGRIKPGGLWLTPVGLEYRKEAVSWTLAWSDVDRIDREESAVQVSALPYASGTGVAAVQPVVLALRPGMRAEVRRTVRWIWSRECRVPPGRVYIDCFDLAGGPQLIMETIECHLSHLRLRDQLGTEWSLPRTAT